jgi:general stress protein 26
MNKQLFLYQYIHKRMIGVLATTNSKGNSEAAAMEFGDTKNLKLIFNTLQSTRKYKNLKNNPHVAFVIGWEDWTTVQYEGIAAELKGTKLAKYKKIMFAKNSQFQKWETLPNMAYFVVTPKWIRYSPYDTKSWELRFR